MRSPKDMEFIQIDITNACNMRCSNCTRFCGNHDNMFFMDYDTFTRAIDSMDGFEGVTGIIGGEPTLHPEFERFANYMRSKYGKPSGGDAMMYPQKDFIYNIHAREFDSDSLHERADGSKYMRKSGAGLWSNMTAKYGKYYEVIQDTFSVQYLNDHLNPSYHQPGLFSRKDLNIPDDEWYALRDKCWIQNTWSATITPKGAFFCEVAGALDMLFDGPGGWPIEPGWWKRTPEEFGDQLHWCEICGFALEGRTFTRDSQDETDDVSPTVYEMIQKTNSPKLRSGHINPVKIIDGVIDESSKPADKPFVYGDRYIAKYEDRFQEQNSVLYKMDVSEVTIASGDEFGHQLNDAMDWNGTSGFKYGDADWLILKDRDDVDVSKITDMIGKRIFNPGVMIKADGYVLFCKGALSLRDIGYDRVAGLKSVNELIGLWQVGKVIKLDDITDTTGLVRESIKAGDRYAIWGAGMLGELFMEMVEFSGGTLSMLCDKSPDKEGNKLGDVMIYHPDELARRVDKYDHLMIAHHLRFEEMYEEAISMGIPKNKIMLPYEV